MIGALPTNQLVVKTAQQWDEYERRFELEKAWLKPPLQTLSYVCRRCDVYGVVLEGDPVKCWICQSPDRLDRR